MPKSSADSTDISSPLFWENYWEKTLKGSSCRANSGYATSRFWDNASRTYDKGKNGHGRERIERVVALLRQQNIAKPGLKALDIGCGTGRLSIALAEEGMNVTALDFSQGMLDKMTAKIPAPLTGLIHPVQADWPAVDIDAMGWRNQFDIVIAHMTPAVRQPKPFLKIMECSRNACLTAGWAGRRTNSVLNALWERIMDRAMEDRPPDIIFQFNMLYTMQLYPEIYFMELKNDHEKSAAEVIEHYVNYFAGVSTAPEETQRRMITEYVESVATDGVIAETNHGRTGTMFWRV